MRLHVEALFTCDESGRLVRANESGGGVAPRFFLGRTSEGPQCWFRRDLDAELVRDLEEAARSVDSHVPDVADPDLHSRFERLLEEYHPVERTWAGPAFTFPAQIADDGAAVVVTPSTAEMLRPCFADWVGDVRHGLPFTALLDGDKAVSLCCSVRITPEAHEAGVETHPDFRGRGHAAKATIAWARVVKEAGAVPLYSTSWNNGASRSVARKLGLVQFGADVHIT